jgi:hypothetical protein
MQIKFLDIAQIEFDEAVEYYNSESAGLGDSFLLEVLNAIERIKHLSYKGRKNNNPCCDSW